MKKNDASPSPEMERGIEGVRTESIFAHAFNLIPAIGPIRMQKLLKFFGSFEKSWQADNFSLAEAGLESFIINKFLTARKNIDIENEWNKINKNIQIITVQDKNYPAALKETHSAPFILYIRGSVAALNNISLAMVGTRKMTSYGQSVCEELTTQLVQRGITIVSGLADGIDTVAHGICLKNHGITVGVLGSGINNNCIFPAQNKPLAEKIINLGGAIISEYPPNMKAQRQFFPARNRIISGLSLGTIVIEAPEKSGALITAYKALEQNKEVFAVPGSIYSSRTEGCHNLIKKGAKLVTNIQDILEELPGDLHINNVGVGLDPPLQNNFNPAEKQILEIISASPTHIDKIIKSCRLSKSQVLSAITILEIKGIIKNIENNQYIIWQKISSSSSLPPKPEPSLNS